MAVWDRTGGELKGDTCELRGEGDLSVGVGKEGLEARPAAIAMDVWTHRRKGELCIMIL